MFTAVCRRTSLVVALAVLALVVTTQAAQAATFTVTTTTDSAGTCTSAGPCSLRQAIDLAQNGDTIVVPAGTYALSSANGELDVTTGVTIDGAGQGSTTIVGPGNDRVMLINGNEAPVTLENLTITGGHAIETGGGGIEADGPGPVVLDDVTVSGNTVTPSSAGFNEGGGGIFSSANVTLNGSTVSGNMVTVGASDGDSGGGGILVAQNGGDLTLNDSTVTGNIASVTADTATETTDNNGGAGIYMDALDLTVSASTVSDNTVTVSGSAQAAPADGGGGIYQYGDNLLLQDSTVSGNTAHGPGIEKGGGGGIFDGGNTSQYLNSTIASNTTDEPATAIPPDSDGGGGVLLDNVTGGVVMANMTITGNSVEQPQTGTAAAGGGINNNLGTDVDVTDSILADNSSAGGGGNCDGPVISAGYNLSNDPADQNTCSLTGPGDLVGASPGLGPLMTNGGPTDTEALLSGSPAIDAGNPAGCTDLVGDTLTTDQRGVPRPQPPGGHCDIGAYERALPIISPADTAVTGTTVLFGAMVSEPDPRAGTVSYQYGPTIDYGSTTDPLPLPGSSSAQTYIGSVSGLSPGTYHFRAVATNPDGTTYGDDGTFTIAAPPSAPTTTTTSTTPTQLSATPPSVTGGKATRVGAYTATLNGVVNPDGAATTIQFQYATNTRFGSHTAVRSVGSSGSGQTVSAPVSDLLPRQTYHVRLVATNSAGNTTGTAFTFRTGAPRKPSGLGVKVTPHAAPTAPFSYRVTGRLLLPAGLARTAGCRGAITARARIGKAVVGRGRATVGHLCGYKLGVTLKGTLVGTSGSARVLVAFGGNAALARSTAVPVVVKFGPLAGGSHP